MATDEGSPARGRQDRRTDHGVAGAVGRRDRRTSRAVRRKGIPERARTRGDLPGWQDRLGRRFLRHHDRGALLQEAHGGVGGQARARRLRRRTVRSRIVRAFLSISLPKLLWRTGPVSLLVQLPFLARLQEVGLSSVTAMTQGVAAATVAAGVTAMVVTGPTGASAHGHHHAAHRRGNGVTVAVATPSPTAPDDRSGRCLPRAERAHTDRIRSRRRPPRRRAHRASPPRSRPPPDPATGTDADPPPDGTESDTDATPQSHHDALSDTSAPSVAVASPPAVTVASAVALALPASAPAPEPASAPAPQASRPDPDRPQRPHGACPSGLASCRYRSSPLVDKVDGADGAATI